MLDIETIRNLTPGCQDKCFLNSAGASLMPGFISDVIISYLKQENQVGGYKAADNARSLNASFYHEVAKLIGAQPGNIAFAHSATDAYTKALMSVRFDREDVIVTTEDDYASNWIQFISLQKLFGVEVKTIGTDKSGDLDISHAEKLISSPGVKLVAITHVPTNSGLIQDVVSVGLLCEKYDIPYLVDACQSVGQLDVDVTQIKCDFLSATGRKFLRGPRGTGFLYVSDQMLEGRKYPYLLEAKGAVWTERDDFQLEEGAVRFENWERSYALQAGLTRAVSYANGLGIENIMSRNAGLKKYFLKQLRSIPGVRILDRGSTTCNIITLIKEGTSREKMEAILSNADIYYSVSTLEWGLLDFRKKGTSWAIRFSPHYFNTNDELDKVCQVIDQM